MKPSPSTPPGEAFAALTVKQIAELRHIASINKGASGIRCSALARAASPRAASNLHCKGLVSRLAQSEAARGERRVYYWLYELTDEGRAALSAIDLKGTQP